MATKTAAKKTSVNSGTRKSSGSGNHAVAGSRAVGNSRTVPDSRGGRSASGSKPVGGGRTVYGGKPAGNVGNAKTDNANGIKTGNGSSVKRSAAAGRNGSESRGAVRNGKGRRSAERDRKGGNSFRKKSPSGLKRLFGRRMSNTERRVWGIVMLFAAIYLLVAIVSYYFTWRTDWEFVNGDKNISLLGGHGLSVGQEAGERQTIIPADPQSPEFLQSSQDSAAADNIEAVHGADAAPTVHNKAGKLGAVIAAKLVGEWFGIFAFCIPLALIIVSLRALRIRPVSLNKSVSMAVIAMILGSVTLGYTFGEMVGVFGSGPGGEAGIAVAEWLEGILGPLGLVVILLMCWAVLVVCILREGVSSVDRWLRSLLPKRAPKERIELPETEESDEEYDDEQVEYALDGVPADTMAYNDSATDGYANSPAGGQIHNPAREYPVDDEVEYAGGFSETAGMSGCEQIEIIRGGDEEQGNIVGAREDEGDEFVVVDVNSGAESDMPQQAAQVGAAVEDDDFEVIDHRGERMLASSLRDRDVPVRRIKPVSEPASDDNIEVVAPDVWPYGSDTVNSTAAGGVQAAINGDAASNVAVGVGGTTAAGSHAAANAAGQDPAEAAGMNTAVAGEGGAEMGFGGVVLADREEQMEILLRERREAEAREEEDLLFRDPTRRLPAYQKPPWQILEDHSIGVRISPEEIRENQSIIRQKLEDFGIRITDKIKATIGPTVTLYEIEPAQGVKISKIRGLEEDIALSLKVQSIRIVTLGQGRGTVGIEVPNSTREVVSMLSIINTRKFQDCNFRLPIALGRTIYNEIYIGDLAKMPHLLVAGATGQGKSVGLNAIITSLLYKKHPAELKFVLVDPKQVELSLYSKLENYFLACMESEENAIITDTQKAVNTLNSLVQVMEERYTLLNRAGERNIADYNDKLQRGGLKKRDGHKFLPYIVVIIDEFADMIMTAGREAEMPITRLAAKARAVGIHLIVATQRPDVKVITGLIKSNIPARIAFKVVSMVDSRTIIDQPGANNLIGMGDMLMYLNGELTRIQCAFIDTPEIDAVTSFIAKQQGFEKPYQLPHYSPPDPRGEKAFDREDAGKFDPMFVEVARFVVSKDQGSTSAIQRNFELGYNRAGRLTDQLERTGIVGRANGSKPREVLVRDLASLEVLLLDLGL